MTSGNKSYAQPTARNQGRPEASHAARQHRPSQRCGPVLYLVSLSRASSTTTIPNEDQTLCQLHPGPGHIINNNGSTRHPAHSTDGEGRVVLLCSQCPGAGRRRARGGALDDHPPRRGTAHPDDRTAALRSTTPSDRRSERALPLPRPPAVGHPRAPSQDAPAIPFQHQGEQYTTRAQPGQPPPGRRPALVASRRRWLSASRPAAKRRGGAC